MPTRWRFCGGGLFTEDNNGIDRDRDRQKYFAFAIQKEPQKYVRRGACLSGFLNYDAMKYIVSVNQAAAVKVAPDLDFGDLAIYDFIKSFAVSGNCITIYENGKCYYWIAHTVIMQELPLLHISTKRGIIKKIDNLINAGILEKYSKCAEMGRTFYTFGVNAALLETNTPSAKSTTVNKSSGGYEQKCMGGMNKSSGNYNINDNVNKDNNNVVGFENPPTPTPDNIINVDVEEITGDPISVSAETITPPSSAAPPLKDEANPNKKTLFRNSTAANRETFFKTFGGEEYATLDMEHYYNAVADWSDSSNTMRTARGWYATVRTFIRGDKEKNKLHKKQTNSIFDWDAAKAYLRM
jgi:hypothetical protein